MQGFILALGQAIELLTSMFDNWKYVIVKILNEFNLSPKTGIYLLVF